MVDISDLQRDLETAQDQFEQYRASLSSTFDDRPVGELTRALEAVLPDLAFYEGQAVAAGVALTHLAADRDVVAVAKMLTDGLVDQQAARRSRDYLAGFAKVLARTTREMAS